MTEKQSGACNDTKQGMLGRVSSHLSAGAAVASGGRGAGGQRGQGQGAGGRAGGRAAEGKGAGAVSLCVYWGECSCFCLRSRQHASTGVVYQKVSLQSTTKHRLGDQRQPGTETFPTD